MYRCGAEAPEHDVPVADTRRDARFCSVFVDLCPGQSGNKLLGMGYDVFITRASSADPSARPITEDEWRELVQQDPDFTLEDQWSTTNPATGETIAVVSPSLGIWHAHQFAKQVLFAFRSDRIVVSNADEEILAKMRTIAAALDARVQGEEGELYDEPRV